MDKTIPEFNVITLRQVLSSCCHIKLQSNNTPKSLKPLKWKA